MIVLLSTAKLLYYMYVTIIIVTAPVYSEIISLRFKFKTNNYSLCMFVDVWTLHRSDEIDAQIEAHEGSF